jgi:hypothetical protein
VEEAGKKAIAQDPSPTYNASITVTDVLGWWVQIHPSVSLLRNEPKHWPRVRKGFRQGPARLQVQGPSAHSPVAVVVVGRGGCANKEIPAVLIGSVS